MAFDESHIKDAVDRYRRERDRYLKLADRVAEICRTDICEGGGIRAQVTYRVKDPGSFERKLLKFSNDPDGHHYESVDDIFDKISDLAGVRISTYQPEDCNSVRANIEKFFSGENNNPISIEHKDKHISDKYNFYNATHAQVYLKDKDLVGTYDNLKSVGCEIQVCTLMAHVWNEIEHDIGYKPGKEGPSAIERTLLYHLGNITLSGDEIISRLIKEHENRISQIDEFADIYDFVSRMRKIHSDIDFTRNSDQLFALIRDMKINSQKKLDNIINSIKKDDLEKKMSLFNEYIQQNDDSGLMMDPNTSDILLFELFQNNLNEIIDCHKGRVGRGHGRPSRLYRIARRYEDYTTQPQDG